jgi:cellobiose phosphorylase
MTSNDLTRREFLAAASAATAASLLPSSLSAAAESSSLGQWIDDDFGLPAFRYTGPLRFPSSPVYDHAPMLPDDPYFLLGNYRLTLFTHASGSLQLLTGERAWGRMNQDPAPRPLNFAGAYQASVTVNSTNYPLTGLDSPAALAANKIFGVGFARYEYAVTPALSITRRISVAPSAKLHQGSSAFLVEVRLRNTGSDPLHLAYIESMLARYQPIFAAWDNDQHEVSYSSQAAEKAGRALLVRFTPNPKSKLAFPPAGQMSRLEQFPPALFVQPIDTNTQTSVSNSDSSAPGTWLGAKWSGDLQPGEVRDLAFVIGYTRERSEIPALASQLPPSHSTLDRNASAFAPAWREKIPAFTNETDPALRREMRWNAATLEQMAIWREYYDETIIPQGTDYDYTWGMVGSMRDQAQHALPFCHTNPAIARSTLRFIMKRTLPDGNILLNDGGFGWSPSGAQQTSDQQLYLFLLLAEYLRVTRDHTILTEPIGYYPLENSGRDTGLAHVRQAFLFLRDRVGVGPHGIILRWNSDWNDMFGWWPSAHPYNDVFVVSESHMNSAMAIVILGDLAAMLDAAQSPDAADLAAAMREYRTQLHEAFMRDLGDRAFPRRAWAWYNEPLGEKEMWLEPQGFTLLNPDIPTDRKRRLYAELDHRLLTGEALGPRQIETPAVQPGTPQGSRENGGFWYALHGPVILGVATFDRATAEALLHRMTFANYARTFPNYWTGLWSASDSLDSSLLPTTGLSQMIPWCAHAHAWPLYCWLRLREERSPA